MFEGLFQKHNFQLFLQFLKRDLLARYKQTFVGFGWAVIQPLVMMIVFSIIFGKLVKMPSDGIPYPIFSYAALLPWTLLASGINFGVNSLTANASLITKVYFPREIIPIASVTAATVDYFVASTIFVGLMIWYKVTLSIVLLMLFPLIIIQLLLMMAIVFVLSVWNVRYRDVRHGLSFIIQIWMYASPVVYPISVVPEKWKFLYMLNPMVGIIDGYRTVIFKSEILDITTIMPAVVFAAIGLPIAYIYFKKAEKDFSDII
jgi:lipopolysaccharide transport system permease protein